MRPLDDDFALAMRMADAAAARSLSYFRRELQQWSKGDGSLATEADLAVEDELRSLLATSRPDDAVLGEERGRTGDGAACWIIDGIDGTVDFAAGSPDWGTLIALEIGGQIALGVCDQPAHKRRYWAVRGRGAFCSRNGASSPQRLRTTSHADLSTARAYLPPAEWMPDDAARAIASRLSAAATPDRQIDHPALQVGSGGYEFAIFFMAGPWDIAAPSIVVEEAGGRFSDLAGQRRLTSGNVVFSNGAVHDDVVAVASTVLSRLSHGRVAEHL
jgi:histidinol-phosphatase